MYSCYYNNILHGTFKQFSAMAKAGFESTAVSTSSLGTINSGKYTCN